MKWTDLPYLWQQTFEVAWKSFLEGGRPIGAIVINETRGELFLSESKLIKRLFENRKHLDKTSYFMTILL